MLDLLIKIGIAICPIYVVQEFFFILYHKKRILLKDKIYLILSTVFTITIIIIDFVTNGAYGYTKALLLCLIMWLLYFCVSSIIVKIVELFK